MSFVWVQQWFALPIVFEGQMGDLPLDSRSQTMDFTAAGLARDDQQAPLPSSSPYRAQDNNTPFYSQLSSISQGQQRPDHRSSAQPTHYHPSHQHESSTFKMGAMSGALPDFNSDTASLQHQASQAVPGRYLARRHLHLSTSSDKACKCLRMLKATWLSTLPMAQVTLRTPTNKAICHLKTPKAESIPRTTQPSHGFKV